MSARWPEGTKGSGPVAADYRRFYQDIRRSFVAEFGEDLIGAKDLSQRVPSICSTAGTMPTCR